MQPHQASRRGRGILSCLKTKPVSVGYWLLPQVLLQNDDGGTITPIMQTGGGFGELARGRVLGGKAR